MAASPQSPEIVTLWYIAVVNVQLRSSYGREILSLEVADSHLTRGNDNWGWRVGVEGLGLTAPGWKRKLKT